MRFFIICVLSISINTVSALLADIYRYPDYNGRLTVSGKVELSGTTNGIYLEYNFIGVVPNAIGGWHIHVGKSCSQNELVGGHYFTPSMVSDPWIPVTYTADIQGKAKGKIEMVDFTIAQIEGRTIVVHAPDGTRVGCGEISSADPVLYSNKGGFREKLRSTAIFVIGLCVIVVMCIVCLPCRMRVRPTKVQPTEDDE